VNEEAQPPGSADVGRALVLRFQETDPEAFAHFVTLYRARVFRWAMGPVRRSQAEDIARKSSCACMGASAAYTGTPTVEGRLLRFASVQTLNAGAAASAICSAMSAQRLLRKNVQTRPLTPATIAGNFATPPCPSKASWWSEPASGLQAHRANVVRTKPRPLAATEYASGSIEPSVKRPPLIAPLALARVRKIERGLRTLPAVTPPPPVRPQDAPHDPHAPRTADRASPCRWSHPRNAVT